MIDLPTLSIYLDLCSLVPWLGGYPYIDLRPKSLKKVPLSGGASPIIGQ